MDVTFTIANTMIGASILNLPYAVAQVGVVPGGTILLLVTLTMYTTATFVVGAIRKAPPFADVEFGGLADITFGARSKRIVDAVVIFELWLAMISQFDLVGSNLSVVFPVSPRAGILACGGGLLVLFYSSPKVLAALSMFSVAAMLMIGIALMVTVAAMPEWASAERKTEPSVAGIFLVIGVSLACYAGHPCLPSFYTEAAEKSRFLSSTAGGFGMAVGYYSLVGAVGAQAFGDRAAQNIMESIGHDLEGRSLG
jgi:amino acid permease